LCNERIRTAFIWNENNYPKIKETASILEVDVEKGKFPYQETTIAVHVWVHLNGIYIDNIFAKPALQARALQFKKGQQIAIEGKVTQKDTMSLLTPPSSNTACYLAGHSLGSSFVQCFSVSPLSNTACRLAVYEPDMTLL